MAFSGFNTGSPFGTPNTTAATPAFGSPATTLFGGTGSPAQSSPFNLSSNQPKLSFGGLAGAPSTQPNFQFASSTPAAQPAQTGFSFGSTPASQPAQTGFNFGATPAPAQQTQAAQPGQLGQPAQSGFSFGATSLAQPTLGATAPASAQAAAPAFSFGATTTAAQPAQSGFNFSAPASAAPTQPAAQTGFNFSAPTQQTQPAQSTQPTQAPTLGLGAPASTGFSFGATTTAAATSAPTLSFGAPSATTTQPTQPAQTGFSFGATTSAPATGLSFGTPATSAQATTGLGQATTTASTGLNFGLGSTLGATKPTLSFGTPTSTTTAAPTLGKLPGLSFPSATSTATAATSAPTGLTFSFSTPASTQAGKTTGSTPATTTTTTTTFKGLGGVDPGQITSGTSTSAGPTDKVALKDNPIPNELMQTVEQFKSFVKTQKSISSEVARASVKPMDKISENVDSMRTLVTTLATSLQKNKSMADKIKAETMKCFQNCEMAQRTQDTPSGLQNQNLAPLDFFNNLVSQFDHDLNVLRLEIENAERHVKSLTSSSELNPQELSLALRKLHDSFVALAGRLQGVHSSVQTLKNQHLSLRRQYLKDTTNIFEKKPGLVKKNTNPVNNIVTFSPGPTPFSADGNLNNLVTLSSLGMTKSAYTPLQPQPSLSTWNNPSGLNLPSLISNTSMINQSTSTLPAGGVFAANTPTFQLQKPPLSNKRGKR
ncbi:unnamed protein product [Bemisia tabaci]|uniref:Nucleoporin Nup58 n=1 Tax=Bemisia tabaci TaxID=7038 RepID=A0A9P0ACU3_BEMTA|nr:unnamed protein product [Bemisia tabaci]